MEEENIEREQYTFFNSPEDRDIDEIFKARDAKRATEQFEKTNMPEYKSLEWMIKKRAEAKEAERKSIKAAAIKKKKKRKRNKLLTKGFAIGALATLITIGGVKLTKEVADRIEYRASVKEAIGIAKNAAEDKLIEAGLATLNDDGNFTLGDNSISDYARLNLSDISPAVIRAYDEAINNPEDFEDFIKSVGYENDSYNFTSTEQYYTVNGYYEPGTTNGSRDVYITYTNNDLVDALNQEQIDSLIKEESSQIQGRGH